MALTEWLQEVERDRRAAERAPAHPPTLHAGPSYVLGLDLGQTEDYSALVVDEIRHRGEAIAQHDIRYLRRWPLRTPYPQIVAEVAAQCARAPLGAQDTLVVDQTGVGRAVVDMFLRVALPVQLVCVTITSGAEASHNEAEWRVPKRDLVATITVLLQDARLRIAARLPEAATLTGELATFQTKVSLAANDLYGAWREGTHDDTVLATALACWWAEHDTPGHVWLL